MPYWDGGYLGNPAIFPFFRNSTTEDVLIIQINPVARREVPTAARDIMNRINEITFTSSLLAEYRAIAFVARLIHDQGRLPRGAGPANTAASTPIASCWATARSSIRPIPSFRPTTISSACCTPRDAVRRAVFLDQHFDDIGVRSTIDLRAEAQAEWA